MTPTNKPAPPPSTVPSPEQATDLWLEAVPGYALLVDEAVNILRCNEAAAGLLDLDRDPMPRGDRCRGLPCAHAVASGVGCGTGELCRNCLILVVVTRAFTGERSVRHRFHLDLVTGGRHRELYVLLSAAVVDYQRRSAVLLIMQDVARLLELHQPLSFCQHCKRVRDTGPEWREIGGYLRQEMEVPLHESCCPDCRHEETAVQEARSRQALLTPRESQVFEQVVRGSLNKQIAAHLGIAEKTVKIHRGRVMTKMRARSIAELVHLAGDLNLFPRGPAAATTTPPR